MSQVSKKDFRVVKQKFDSALTSPELELAEEFRLFLVPDDSEIGVRDIPENLADFADRHVEALALVPGEDLSDSEASGIIYQFIGGSWNVLTQETQVALYYETTDIESVSPPPTFSILIVLDSSGEPQDFYFSQDDNGASWVPLGDSPNAIERLQVGYLYDYLGGEFRYVRKLYDNFGVATSQVSGDGPPGNPDSRQLSLLASEAIKGSTVESFSRYLLNRENVGGGLEGALRSVEVKFKIEGSGSPSTAFSLLAGNFKEAVEIEGETVNDYGFSLEFPWGFAITFDCAFVQNGIDASATIGLTSPEILELGFQDEEIISKLLSFGGFNFSPGAWHQVRLTQELIDGDLHCSVELRKEEAGEWQPWEPIFTTNATEVVGSSIIQEFLERDAKPGFLAYVSGFGVGESEDVAIKIDDFRVTSPNRETPLDEFPTPEPFDP